MKTKEQIFEFIATELKNNNTVIIATLGNGSKNGLNFEN